MSGPVSLPSPPPQLTAVDGVTGNDSPSIVLEPLIEELIYSRLCVPGVIFLVEGIDANIDVGPGKRAVRLMLGDGELCIQALLGPELHSRVDSGEIYAGCYVQLGWYRVRSITLTDGDEDYDEGGSRDQLRDDEMDLHSDREKSSPGEMVYLVVRSAEVVGWNNLFLEMLKRPPSRVAVSQPTLPSTVPLVQFPSVGQTTSSAPSKQQELGSAPPPQLTKPVVPARIPPKTDEPCTQQDVEDDSDLDDAFETMTVSEAKIAQRRIERLSIARAVTARKRGQQLPWMSSDPTQPLKLTPLRSIPNLPYKQNWTVNVIAVVSSLSAVEPSHLPPFTQRTARLADPTTSKQVLLTVFVEPEAFNPKVGSVVLLVGVKNHRFDGGCLKKYMSDQPKQGTTWWFENPWDLEWCDVGGLKSWWDAL